MHPNNLITLKDRENVNWLHDIPKDTKEMRSTEGELVIIAEYNKNHDPKTGRFTTGKRVGTLTERLRAFNSQYLPEKDNEAFKQFLRTNIGGSLSKDPAVIKQVLDYQATGFDHINKYLQTNIDGTFDDKYKTIIENMDNAFTQHLTKDATLYRKIDEDWYGVLKGTTEFTEKNYGSTSISGYEANRNAWGKGPIFRIRAPKGLKVSVPDMYSGPIDTISAFTQAEVILPRNTKYRVRSIHMSPNNSTNVVDVDIIEG